MKVIKGAHDALHQQSRQELLTLVICEDEQEREAAKQRLLALSERMAPRGQLSAVPKASPSQESGGGSSHR